MTHADEMTLPGETYDIPCVAAARETFAVAAAKEPTNHRRFREADR